jgi:IclR family transcriptional regulator, pca regulon regulatory protein
MNSYAHYMSTLSPGIPRTKALQRAVAVLRAVGHARDGATAAGLARVTRLPRATVTRTVQTLADAGLVERGPDGWVLGYELVRLARSADPYRAVVEAARVPLTRLRDAVGESALFAVPRDGPGMEILLQLDAQHHVGVTPWVGAEIPLYASSAGKLVLAELDGDDLDEWLESTELAPLTGSTIVDPDRLRVELTRVRSRGYAELVDELESGLTSMSAPVRALDGQLTAMIGISGPTFRLGASMRRGVVPVVLAAAAAVERALERGMEPLRAP